MIDYKSKAIRIAKTKGRKYGLMIIPVDSQHADIIETVNGDIRGRHCNIPTLLVHKRFDSIIRDSKLFDGINYYESD